MESVMETLECSGSGGLGDYRRSRAREKRRYVCVRPSWSPDLRGVLGETNVDHTNPATAGHLLKKRPRSGGEPPEPL